MPKAGESPRLGLAVAGVVAIGISAAACGNAVAMYGPAPYDASFQNDGGGDAGGDADAADGGLVGAYGPPPPQDASGN